MDKNSLEVNGNLYGVGVAQDGSVVNQNLILPKHKVLTQLSSKLGNHTLIGREKELKDIEQKLDNSDTLLINGVGGIGKSTIASNYLHIHKEQYDYYGYFEGINGFIRELESAFDIEKKLGRDSLLDILREFRGLENSKKLLVIDDVKEIEKNKEQIDKILALKDHGCKILLTSREQIEGVAIYFLDILTVNDAKALFNSIFKMEDESLLKEIVTYLDCHAFFVEMTATSLSVNRERTPEKMIEMFRSGNLSKIKANKEQSFNDFLNKQFSLDSLDDEDSLLLKKLSLLPSIEIDFKFLTMIFGLTDEEDIEDLKDLLNFLVEKGWLSSNRKTYKLHQIIKEFIWANHQPTLQEIDKIVLFFAKLIKNNNDIQSAVLLKGYLVYFESIDDVLNKVGVFNESLTEFWNNLGLIYEYNGLYTKALFFYIKVMKIRRKILGEEHLLTAISYSNLAVLYQLIGEYRKSEQFSRKAIKIKEKVLGEDHLTTTISYSNLAVVYHLIGEYKKSEQLSLKVLKIREKVLGEEHPDIATSYSNLGVVYYSMGKDKKAEAFSLKAFKIVERVLGEEHPKTATSANNLAEFYQSMGEYKKAKAFSIKALKIKEKVLGEEHPSTATSYNTLAKLYQLMGEYKKVEALSLTALKIFEKVLGENHLHTAASHNNLGFFYYEQGDLEKAYDYMKKAVTVRTKVLPEKNLDLINSKKWLEIFEAKLHKKI